MKTMATGSVLAVCATLGCSSSFTPPTGASSSSTASTAAASGSSSGRGSSSAGSGSTAGASSGASATGGSGGSSGGDSGDGGTLAARHPCDQGIGNDPAVVWAENFSESSVAAFQARYDNVNNPSGESFVGDVPAGSCSANSIRLLASGDAGANATDFYKEITPGLDEWYVRWYAKYESSVFWHHSGVWFGGYNPPLPYGFPHAGDQPSGDDRISVAIEPAFFDGGPSYPQLDTYNYWRGMHSWVKSNPVPVGAYDYFGNAVVNQAGFQAVSASWLCIEVHVKLNSDPTSSAGGAMDIWRDDLLLQHYDPQTPLGFWTADKFCPPGADDYTCVTYPPPAGTPPVALDLQWRTTTALQLNYFWPQNYITTPGAGVLQFADMVVATTRVGCIQPKP